MPDESAIGCPDAAQLDQFVSSGSMDEDIRVHVESCQQCGPLVKQMQENNLLLSRIMGAGLGRHGSGQMIAGGETPSIDGFTIHEEIHRGGQGVVHRATQDATRRTVALKVLLRGTLATSRQRQRFEREVELVARMEHPNIVTVFESGVTRDGCHYLAMQHVDGSPLDEYVASVVGAGQLTPKRSLEQVLMLFQTVCNAVHYAHQHGVIHRDLKPGNILVDAKGQPFVLDFGLAKLFEESLIEAPASEVSIGDEFMGTLAYAAPEQTLGDSTLIDVRTDIYALGVILYKLLTGEFPYEVVGPMVNVLRTIAEDAPKAPRAWSRADKANERNRTASFRLDDELETIILKTLAKEKQRRYQSADHLARDIECYLTGRPIDAKRDSGWYVLRKTAVRHKLGVSIAVSFVMIVLVFGIGMSWMYARADTEARKAHQINLFLQDTLGSVRPSTPQREATVREVLDEAVLWIEVALGGQPEVEAALRMTIGNSYRSLGRFADAEEQLTRALAIRKEQLGPEHVDVAASLNSLAQLAADRGAYEDAHRLFEESLDMRRRILGDEHFDVSMSLQNLGYLFRAQGAFVAAEEKFRDALALRRKLLGSRHPDVAMVVFNLAEVLGEQGRMVQAERLHREALEFRLETLHAKHPDVARSVGSLIKITEASGRLDEAAELRRLYPNIQDVGPNE